MNKMYDILEQCLLEIEQGADIDTVLFHYPEFADELRPILETSLKAMEMAAPEPSVAMVHVNRAELLQRAAEMREAKVKSPSRIWFASLRRLVVTVAVIVMLFISGTGFVHAASTTIPGDNLYPVKRTWEDILLLFTFNSQQREQMEFDHENERLEELNELFTEGRSVKVDFKGYVTSLSATEWRVSAITIIISPQTVLPNDVVSVGAAVRIIGVTQSDKTVLAERIELLPAGAKLPTVHDTESESEEEIHEVQTPQGNENSSSESESENEAPPVVVTETPKVESEPKDESFQGILESMDNRKKIWMISGQLMDMSVAEINGNPVVGATVKGEGYRAANGVFIVTKIEIKSGSSDDGSNSNNDDNSNDDTNDDHGGGSNSNDDD